MNFSIVKFWPRVFALLIDIVSLGTFGFILGLFFKDAFVKLGNNGILIGFSISLLYFTVLNSYLQEGQTFGKKLMKIQVIDEDEKFLTLQKSFLRSLILLLPYFLLDFKFPGVAVESSFNQAKSLICTIFIVGVILLYILNKFNRKTLHDFILKTYVVSEGQEFEPMEIKRVKPYIFYIYGSIASLLMFLFFININRNFPELDELVLVKNELEKVEGVKEAGAYRNTTTYIESGETKVTESFTSNIFVDQALKNQGGVESLEHSPLIKDVVKTILTKYPSAKKQMS
ncbi:hypothetical protein AHMF7605_18905 [Adhaeribacter arboris]|uniref:RDD domain-containing protein n=1 Tax=Adhaeribacter arboris TaxID=2072846 RepID=A0A2T2YIU6_9BACT|nr:RDD family protein [Adhaeribacter arboris]PSR55426.1 hypothetical protein AHMF7605_18905 [Adhaeribacter arboris]